MNSRPFERQAVSLLTLRSALECQRAACSTCRGEGGGERRGGKGRGGEGRRGEGKGGRRRAGRLHGDKCQ